MNLNNRGAAKPDVAISQSTSVAPQSRSASWIILNDEDQTIRTCTRSCPLAMYPKLEMA